MSPERKQDKSATCVFSQGHELEITRIYRRGKMKKVLTMVCAVILIHTAVGYAASSDIYSYYLPYFTEDSGMWTGTGLRNSDKSRNANVSILVYNQNGTVIKTEKIVLPPGGQDARVVATGASHKGWIQMISTRPLTGLCFFGKQGYKGYMADITLISNLEKALHIPHAGQNFQWDTTIMICNPNPDATTATLTFFDKDGGKLPSKNYDIPGNGSVDCALTDLVGKKEYVNGSVEISAEQGLAAFALYTDIKWENGRSYAGISAVRKPVVFVPEQIDYTYYLPYFIQGSANWTGVAFRNSNPSRAANVSVTVFGQNGAAEELDKIILPADGQTAFVAKPSDLLQEGWLRVKSDHPLTGLCFFGTAGYDSHMADITFIPQLSKTLYVPHVGQNYQWDTTIMVCNPNLVSANLSLRFVDKDGNTLPAKTYTVPSNGSAAYPVADLVQEEEYVNGSVEISSDQGLAAFALYTDLKWRDGKNFAGISAIDPGVIPDDPDKDGDGYVENDCNNNNPAIHPNAQEICGDRVDQDCNGADLECGPSDRDDDGDGYTENQGDCDDRSVFIGPKAQEICGDNIDQDCDGYDIVCNPKDMDNDGDGYSENQGDCNDVNASIHPDAKEICEDKIDQNCDGADIQCGPDDLDNDADGYTEKQGDCDDTNPDIRPNAVDICNDGIDQDCNGIDRECSLNTTDDDGDGFTENQGDCNDTRADIYPGADEICGDRVDQDCSGADLECNPLGTDNDLDGYTEYQGDCDDANPAIHPNAVEICGDGIDQNCNGSEIECGSDDDSDNDGDGYTENQGDCNDANYAIHPNAVEICGDSIDQDCSGSDIQCESGDHDGDGYTENQGDCNDANYAIHPNAVEICGDSIDQDCSGADIQCESDDHDGDGFTENQGDCDDANYAIHPNAVEICGDGTDQDCSGSDLQCSSLDTDNDGDGFTENQGDCNDANSAIHPNAAEVCGDGTDQDCSGADSECSSLDTDNDGDGFTENQGDCDDTNAAIHPNAVEICGDSTDQDCSGADSACSTDDRDNDNDGYTKQQGDCNDYNAHIHPNAVEVCGDSIDQNCDGSDLDCDPDKRDDDKDGFTEKQGDCNDNDSSIYPKAQEICDDGIDQDCSGADLICSKNPNDIDDDGDRYTENQGDCNDAAASIHPNALEICGDGIDQDCNGSDCDPNDALDNDGDYYTENTGDCNDHDRTVYPGADEVCGDGIDQDCDGSDAVCIAEIVGGSDTQLGYAARNEKNERIAVTAAKNNGSIVVVNGGGYVSPSGNTVFYQLEQNRLSTYGYLPKYLVVEGWVFGFSYNFITKKADILSKSPEGLINSYFDVPTDTARLSEINPNGFYSVTQVSAQGGMGNALTAVGDIIQILSCAIAEIAGNISSVQEGCAGTLISGSVPVGSFETVVCEGGVSECANIDLYDLYPLVTASQEKINVYLSDFKDNDGDGRTERDGDCNDYNRDIYPGATELCDDGIDNNCDGIKDESDCRDLSIPVASFKAEPSSGKAPLVVNLDASGSYCLKGRIASYSWSCSDGQSAARSTAVMAFNEPGTYTVTLTVTTEAGKTDTAGQDIVVGIEK